MAYDNDLAERVRHTLGARGPFAEIPMFGGLCFTVGGHMTVGVLGEDLMVRVGADAHEAALKLPGAREMDFTKRPMRGFVFVGSDATADDGALAGWVDRGLAFTSTLPPKTSKPRRARADARATRSRG